MKALKKTILIFLILSAAAAVYLFFFVDDPGYYIIARHSDTPSQIIKFFPRIAEDPEVSLEDFEKLYNRFSAKYSETGDEEWKVLYEKTQEIIKEKKLREQ